MKKFNFRLETVLTYRAHLEEKEKQLLASMQLLYEHERLRLSDMANQQARVQQECAIRQGARFNKVDIELYRAYLRRLFALIQSKQKQLTALQAQIDKQKQAVAQAYKNRRILELLKAKQWEAYQQDFEKQEQQLVDDLQLAKYSARSLQE